MTRFKAAIFDLDGVLADTAGAHYTAWKAIADELGAPFDEAANEAIKGVDRMGSLEIILRSAELELDDGQKAAAAARKNHMYLEALEALGPADLLLPGAIDLISGLKRAGLVCAVASASRNAPLVLARAGLESLLDYVADPARNRPKPAPDLFLDCAAALDAEPDRCIAFEDSAAGVAAIRAAGMTAIGIGDSFVLGAAHRVYPATSSVRVHEILAA